MEFYYFFEFFYKMAAGGHFGCLKITFDHISGHFRSIQHFFKFFCIKWPPAPILDVRNSLSNAFMAISDRYATSMCFGFFYIMAAVGHFEFPKFSYDRISVHFRSICNFIFLEIFDNNGCRRPFCMSEIHFQSHFWPFYINTDLFLNF